MRGRQLCVLAVCAVLAGVSPVHASDPPISTNPAPVRIPLTPQVTPPESYFQSLGGGMVMFGRNVLQDVNVQFQSPFRYARAHPYRFTAGALGLVAMVATDQYTYPVMTDWVGDTGKARAQKLSDFGRGGTGMYLLAGVGVLGLVSGSAREQESSVLLVESLLTSAVWAHSLKTLAGRERPREADENVAEWEGPHLMGENEGSFKSLRSFPSGHTTGAFATATVLAHQYPAKGVVPVLAYTGAAVMGYSRVVVGAHWLSDVVVGALIGYGSARTVINNHEARTTAPNVEPKLQWGVNLTPEYRGVNLEYDF